MKIKRLLLGTVLIAAACIIIPHAHHKYIQSKTPLGGDDEPIMGENFDPFEESYIPGYTWVELMLKGLAPVEDADSDGDGLSDYDELITYHSKPKKISTAGDLYTDAYKVEHDMDLNKKYDGFATPNIEPDNVSLETKDIKTTMMGVEKDNENFRNYDGFVEEYYFYAEIGDTLKGTLYVDVSKYGNDIRAYYEDVDKKEKKPCTIDNGILKLKLDAIDIGYIYITTNSDDFINSSKKIDKTFAHNNTSSFDVCVFPFMELLNKPIVHVDSSSFTDEELRIFFS